MRIKIKLSEALDKCNDWLEFCKLKGIDEYAVSVGYGDEEVELTLEEAKQLGLLRGNE